jgi:hypothetical protein
MRNSIIIPGLLLIVTMTSVSCKRNPYKVNTSSINESIEIKRLEKDLFTIDPGQVVSSVPVLKKKYGGFLQLFSFVINAGDVNERSFGDLLLRFCSDKQNYEVYKMTEEKFGDIGNITDGLREGFKHYRYYFPGKNVPAVYTCITGFNNSIITADSLLGISLDRYLGADCPYYPRLSIFKYQAAKMTPENIVPDCMFGWGSSEWDFHELKYPVDNVLSEIIHNGKLKYFEKCMLPETSDELIFGFTGEQMKFCLANESQMWQYMAENNLLFSTDQLTIRKLTADAPFTSYFGKESPGRAADWIGFRIVESYMKQNHGEKLEAMMKNTDVQDILEKAKYSPR